MRFEGILTAWHGERGYGAIAAGQGGQELFVHFSAFPRDGAPPQVGEALSFEIVTTGDGRKQAEQVRRMAVRRGAVAAPPPGFMAPAPQRRRRLAEAQRNRRIAYGGVAVAVIVGVLGWVQASHSQGRLFSASGPESVRAAR